MSRLTSQTNTRVREEILKCRKDFVYFAKTYLKLVDINGKVKRFKLYVAQEKIKESMESNPHTMIIKARKLGSTTFIAGYFLWKALFNKNTRIAVVAHTDEAVKEIFSIYQHFYNNLPHELKVKAIKNRDNQLLLVTGSQIKIGTSSSESFRGQTYHYIHASEYAFWKNLGVTIAGLFGTVADNATIILESTANGLNEANEMWTGESGFLKLFLGWKLDDRLNLKKAMYKDITPEERKYIKEYELTDTQANWMVNRLRTKCANNWQIFNQEFPATAEIAFVTSGQRFFPEPFPVVDAFPGYKEYEKKLKYHVYSMGVDTASGSPGGDFSSVMVLDVTDTDRVRMVATFYRRIPPAEFRDEVRRIAVEYGALCVIESNSYGLSIVEGMMEDGYSRLYRETRWDRTDKRWMEKIGFSTTSKSRNLLLSRLYEYVSRKWLNVICPNFMVEANALIYNSRGRIEAASGKHDDMVIAAGLALMGIDQVSEIVEELAEVQRPSNIRDMVQWELATGRSFKSTTDADFSESPIDAALADIPGAL